MLSKKLAIAIVSKLCFIIFIYPFSCNGSEIPTVSTNKKINISLFSVSNQIHKNNVNDITLSNQIFINYKITNDYFLGLIPSFGLQNKEGGRFILSNPAIRIGKYNIINSQNKKLLLDFRFFLPFSDESRLQRMIYGVQTTQILGNINMYSDWFYGSFNSFRKLWFNQVGSGKSFIWMNTSYIGYNLNEQYFIAMRSILNTSIKNSKTENFSIDNLRLGAGAGWRFGKNFLLSAYITKGLLNLSIIDTSFYAFLVAKVL